MIPMKPDFLSFLQCPSCAGELALDGDGHDGTIRCLSCSSTFPIENGIPVFVREEDRVENYSKNFEMYWTQLPWHDSAAQRQRFYELTEWRPEDLAGKVILDAGCGGGRWLYQFANAGAKTIVAFDLTRSIHKAADLCRDFDQIHYAQADIFRLPFKPGAFDIVHCHGVLMTLPDQERGVKNLCTMVAPGGEAAFLVYRNLTWPQKLIDDVLCAVTKRLPTRVMFYLSLLPTLLEYVPGAVFLLENVIHLSGQRNFVQKHLHNFDWYSCAHRHRTDPEDLRKQMEAMGARTVRELDTNGFRVASRFEALGRFKRWALRHGLFLKATLGVRARF